MPNCPDENTIARFLRGTLARSEVQAVEEHVDRCSVCAALLAALAQLGEESARGAPAPGGARDGVESGARATGAAGQAAATGAAVTGPVDAGALSGRSRPVAAGATAIAAASLGRYAIERLLGAGAMGEVHAAFDPVLGRRVALKLLRLDRVGVQDVLQANARLLREARLAAALSHPNVVHVYDAGVLGGQVFVAMELVDGPTLAEWLRAAPRDHRAILARFREAALGLAAAHEAGILHRDFKPANVLVGPDGRARVSDFGLARASEALPAGQAPSFPGAAAPGVDLPGSIATRTGALVGTPAYMSPEQLAGGALDARSDQFSFCVALYEALYGARPFGGDTLAERRAAIEARPPAPPLHHRGAPPALATALLRGLSASQEHRYPSMRALVAALDAAMLGGGEIHIRIHTVCQVLAFAVHLGLFALFLVTDADEADDSSDDGAEILSTMSAVEVVEERVFDVLYLGLIVLAVLTPFGLVWTPLNVFGLLRRAAWARRSTMAYGIVSILTGFGLPYGLYTIWSLRRPAVRESFAPR